MVSPTTRSIEKKQEFFFDNGELRKHHRFPEGRIFWGYVEFPDSEKIGKVIVDEIRTW